ncbi:MAG: ribulose-phosphate 3-epimerase [Candidatus Yanofskybacteria bacterium]|nr:ribulose-phosphate 3-epimerase [Candidatus Yanofskybacteria bacterium]
MQKVIPAILTADPAYLKERLDLFRGESEWLHIDIIDGVFVPNFSVPVLALDGAAAHFHLEMHLMVADPVAYLKDCEAIGAKRVVFHIEAIDHPQEVLKKAKQYSFQVGLALSPGTDPGQAAGFADSIDWGLVLGVVPGFQGQKIIPSRLRSISELKATVPVVSFDGGITEENIREVFAAGADYVLVGSAIMRAEDPVAAFHKLSAIAEQPSPRPDL